MFSLMHRRDDGSFVINLKGSPYHVLPEDPLFPEVQLAAKGLELPPEPEPEPGPAQLPAPREWLDRLPAVRQAAITTEAMGDPQLLLWLLRSMGAREIDPASPETIAGVEALHEKAVISEEEKAALLAPP